MTPTYQALELAASSLIDAVDDCTMAGDSDAPTAAWRLLFAVGDTCDALGAPASGWRARKLAGTFEDSATAEVAAAGWEATAETLATEVRSLTLPWFDGRSADGVSTDGLAAVAAILTDVANNIGDLWGVERYGKEAYAVPEVCKAEEIAKAKATAERAAEMVEEAAGAAGGIDGLARAMAEHKSEGMVGVLGALAETLDEYGHEEAAAIVRGAR